MDSIRQSPPRHIDAFVRSRNGEVINSTINVSKSRHQPGDLCPLGEAVLTAARAGGAGRDVTLSPRDVMVRIEGQRVLVHACATGAEVTFDWPEGLTPDDLTGLPLHAAASSANRGA